MGSGRLRDSGSDEPAGVEAAGLRGTSVVAPTGRSAAGAGGVDGDRATVAELGDGLDDPHLAVDGTDVASAPVPADRALSVTTDIVATQVRHLAVVVAVTAVLAVTGFFVLGNATIGDGVSIAYPIGLIGTVGGTANAARRVQLLARQPETTQRHVPRVLAIAQTYLSPIVGATFALLLYLVFLGGMLQGEFFPEFACGAADFTDYGSFSTCDPTTNADAALLMVWGFVAGFAERYVPNVLDRFVRDE